MRVSSFLNSWPRPFWLLALPGLAWFIVLGVGGRLGPYAWWSLIGLGLAATLYSAASLLLILLNLVRGQGIRVRSLLFLGLGILAAWPGFWLFGKFQIAYPADLQAVQPQVSIRLPFNRAAQVAWGGDTLQENYHAWMPVERWAYDLFAPPAAHGSHRLEDYGIYGESVLAPAAGTIVGCYEEEPDIAPGADEFLSMLGNYVFIRLDESGTYLVLAHLKQNSVQVEVGQFVAEGTPLALVGNSGTSSEPHLHIHHQRQDPSQSPLLLAEGLPLFFRDIDGPAMPHGGIEVRNGIEVNVGEMIAPLQ